MSDARAIGIWLRQQRLAAGMTQEELADKSGLSARTISNLERGRTGTPYPRSLQSLAAALGLADSAGAELPARLRAGRLEDASPKPPRQLPAAVRHFTGRDTELDTLVGLVGADVAGNTAVISAIDGMAGIGKTALAVHAAHRLAEAFPDGQLFLDLRGYTQGQPPRTADQALGWLLQALGVPTERIPKSGDQAAALYRQRLSGSRTLIVLDNAATEDQVRPLLPGPGGGSCLVLVTSRKRLRGLVGAHVMSLDLLAPPDAVALLYAVAGEGRISPDDHDLLAGEIAELCGYLPLALRIAASLLRHRPAWTLGFLAGQLRDQQRRVTSLSDGERELAAVFDLSYVSLDDRLRRLWRRLGLVPGPDLDSYAAAALLQIDPMAAAELLDDLVEHNLLTEYAPGRYRLHDLLRVHARTLADTDPAPEREAAVDRLLHYYGHTCQRASLLIARNPRAEADGPEPGHSPALADAEAARRWLRIEYASLDAAFTHARAHGLDRHTLALAAGLAEILQADGPLSRALEIQQGAAETAERLDLPGPHADALTELGRARRLGGNYPGADDALIRALKIYRELGDRRGEAAALTDLGRVRHMTGDFAEAGESVAEALEIYRGLGDRLGTANTLFELGRVRYMTGDYPGAVEALDQALGIYRALGNRHGEAYVLTNVGRVRYLTGDYPGAGDAADQALEIYRELDNRGGEAIALNELGRVRVLTGDCPGAEESYSHALEIYHALSHRHGEAYTLTELGHVRTLTGDYAGAEDAAIRALAIYREIGNHHGEADAMTALGRIRYLTGDYSGSEDALTRALEIYRALGNRGNEAWALNHYAATVAAIGRRSEALALYRQALGMNRELNKPDDEAISLEGIAEHHLAAGDPAEGIAHLRQALAIYRRLGVAPDIRRVTDRLNGARARAEPAETCDGGGHVQ